MTREGIVRAIFALATAVALGWIVHKTSWVEVEVDTPARGEAAKPYYSLKKIAAAAGATVVERSSLEAMPPTGATMFLETRFWDLFPARDEALRRWVEAGGRLVLLWSQVPDDHLRWVPPTFVRHATPRPKPPGLAASAARGGDDDDENDRAAQAAPPSTPPPHIRQAGDPEPSCENLVESPASPPAFEPGRPLLRCLAPLLRRGCVDPSVRPNPHARPVWRLGNDQRTYAMRVAVGAGSVTAVAECLPVSNDAVMRGDHALIDAAVLQLQPGAQLWLVDDASGEALPVWLWHHARPPLLLTVAAILLALWRLVVRFGPREAAPATARRSMGEQVRGTGQFIAATDPQALHAATRQAFDDAARTRVEGWADLDDEGRASALAALLGPAAALDERALVSALSSAPRALPAEWLAAIDLVEQARRALLRATAGPASAPRP